jgi:hypothetical protein
LSGFGEAIFILGFQGAEDQFGQQAQIASIALVECKRPFGECFEKADNAPPPAQRNGDHGAGAQLAAGFDVHTGIRLGVIAHHDLRGAEGGSGESGITVNARTDVRAHGARRRAQNNLIIFSESDRQTIRASDCNRTLSDQLKHFVEKELLAGFELCRRRARIESAAARSEYFSPANLFVQSGEGKQCLQRITVRRAYSIFRGRPTDG